MEHTKKTESNQCRFTMNCSICGNRSPDRRGPYPTALLMRLPAVVPGGSRVFPGIEGLGAGILLACNTYHFKLRRA